MVRERSMKDKTTFCLRVHVDGDTQVREMQACDLT